MCRTGGKRGLRISAYDVIDSTTCGIEIKDAWIIGVQFHPEYESEKKTTEGKIDYRVTVFPTE
ncbi:MAG: hypothetical protein DRN59_03540 [Thaumarchaeota archaeon]|nr:MAG: hypothetical protein DRN59_03540 [Nitrososphaerota archaeon]